MLVCFPCPHCARSVSVSHEYAGQRGPCPYCHETLDVPPVPSNGRVGTGLADAFDRVAGYHYQPFGRHFGPGTAVLMVFWVFLFALVNFALVPLTSWCQPNDPEAALVYLCAGVIGAQTGLHAIWCILAPVGWVKRFAAGVGAALILFAAWALGYAFDVSDRGYPGSLYWENVFTGLLCLPLLAVAIQSPLWIVRNWCGWRIVHAADASASSGARTFGIRDMLVATAVLALALSAARLAEPGGVTADADFLFPLAIGALAAGGISLLTTLPVLVATLRSRRWWLALGATLGVYVIIILASLEIVAAISGRMVPAEVYTCFVWIGGGFLGCLSGALLLMRRLGYRLRWGRPRQGHEADTPLAGGAPAGTINPLCCLPGSSTPQSGWPSAESGTAGIGNSGPLWDTRMGRASGRLGPSGR